MCLEIYELDLAKFISVPGLAWQPTLKKTQVKLDLAADIDMLLMIEKGIRGEICNAVHRYAKANNTYMPDYDVKKESQCLRYWDVNSVYGWAIPQKLPAFNFEWVEDILQFNEVFIKKYDEKCEIGYILEVHVEYPKKLYELHSDLPHLPKRMKLRKVEQLVTNL